MAVTVDSLEVQITADSTSASSAIDNLTSSLSRLKAMTQGGIGLVSVANAIKRLNTNAASFNGSAIDSMADSLSKSLNKLASIGKINLNKTLANNIVNVGAAVDCLKGVDMAQVDKLADSLGKLQNLANLKGIGRIGDKVKSFIDAINAADIAPFTQKIEAMSTALDPLASRLTSISTALTGFSQKARSASSALTTASASATIAGTNYMNLWAKIHLAYAGMKKITTGIAGLINNANEYIEDVNLFNVSMGQYAQEAGAYAQQVSSVMGIDPGEWIRNQSIFQTIITGFGNSADAAYVMSKNLTQLGYDLSSFFNISYEDAFQKLQSGIAGELEPLRRLGYDLSAARLQQEAYALGINQSVSSMTQAEKSMLRYHAIMTQVTTVQGDMARTLSAPSNQLRVLRAELQMTARAWGQLFVPVLQAVLPYLIAVAQVLRMIAEVIASLFGIKMPAFNSSLQVGSVAAKGIGDGANKAASGLGKAAKKAKELKNNLLGIDELNILSRETDTAGSGGGGGGGAGGGGGIGGGDGLGIDLPQYDFLNGATSKAKEIAQEISKWLGIDKIHKWADVWETRLGNILTDVVAVGAAFAAWKISKSVMTFFKFLQQFKGFTALTGLTGLVAFFGDIAKAQKYIKDILQNGADWYNVAGMLSTAAGLLGDAFIAFGQLKTAGVLKIVQGVGEIVAGIAGWRINGFDPKDGIAIAQGVADVVAGIGLIKQNWMVVGFSFSLSGLIGLFDQFQQVVTAIRTGDWSGVDAMALCLNAAQLVGGVLIGLYGLKKKLDSNPISGMGKQLTDTAGNIGDISAGTETLSGNTLVMKDKMKSLVTNLGYGIVAIAEVAGAALIITGSIALLGVELQAVVKAWSPVLDNGRVAAQAMGYGAVILASVGTAAGLIGHYGGINVAKDILIGTGVLAEISLAADFFVKEIEVMGGMLQDVADAWTPVNRKKKIVTNALETAAILLAAVGGATGALGAITIASGGTVAAAIAVGTGVLIEISEATKLFIDEVGTIGDRIKTIIKKWEPVNKKMPDATTAIDTSRKLLTDIGIATAALGGITIATAGTLPAAIGLGTLLLEELKESFKSFTDDMIDVSKKLRNDLFPELKKINKKLPDLATNMHNYATFMSLFAGYVVSFSKDQVVVGLADAIKGILDLFRDDPIESLTKDVNKNNKEIEKLTEKLDEAVPDMKDAYDLLKDYKGYLKKIESLTDNTDDSTSLSAGVFVNMKEVGKNLITGFTTGIKNNSSQFKDAAKDIINGFNTQIHNYKSESNPVIISWANDIQSRFRDSSYGAINNTKFGDYGKKIVAGFDDAVRDAKDYSRGVMVSWAKVIKDGFTDRGAIKSKTFSDYADNVTSGFNDRIKNSTNSSITPMASWGGTVRDGFVSGKHGKVNGSTFSEYASDIVGAFNKSIGKNDGDSKSPMQTWGNEVVGWFNKPDDTTLRTHFVEIGKNIIRGFIEGANNSSLRRSAEASIEEFGKSVIRAGKKGTKEHSPSAAFRQIGEYVIEGFNIGLTDVIPKTYDTMDEWLKGVNSYTPTIGAKFTVDTSEMRIPDSDEFMGISGVSVERQTSVAVSGYKEGMAEFYNEYMKPMMQEMASDIKRQADKKEQTIVQVGNKTITDVVTKQRNANGYNFVA